LLESRRKAGNDRLIEFSRLFIAPIWFGIIHNGLLDIADLFEAHRYAIFDQKRI